MTDSHAAGASTDTQFTPDAVSVARSSDDFGPTVTSPLLASMRSTYIGDWLETPSAQGGQGGQGGLEGFAVAVPSMPLGAAPTARVGKREVRVGAAVYRVADGKNAKNVADGRVDKDGRLVLAAGDAQLADKLARSLVMIYVHKLQR